MGKCVLNSHYTEQRMCFVYWFLHV